MTVTHRVPKGTFHRAQPVSLILSDADAPARSRGGDAPKPPKCATARVCEASRSFRFHNPDRWNDAFNDGSAPELKFPQHANGRCHWIKANRSRKAIKPPALGLDSRHAPVKGWAPHAIPQSAR